MILRLMNEHRLNNSVLELGNVIKYTEIEQNDELVLSFTVQNFDSRVIELLLGMGLFFNTNQVYFIDGFLGMMPKPLFTLILQDNDGIRTFKNIVVTSGIPWDDIVRGECSELELEFIQFKNPPERYIKELKSGTIKIEDKIDEIKPGQSYTSLRIDKLG